MTQRPPKSTLTDTRMPYTTHVRSHAAHRAVQRKRRCSRHRAGRLPTCAFPQLRSERQTHGQSFHSRSANRHYHRCARLGATAAATADPRSEEHKSELQSLMRLSSAAFCLNKKHTYSLTHRLN